MLFGERTYKGVWLRYNTYADEVEFKINASKDKNEKIRYTELLSKNKKDKTSGNIFILFEGRNYAFYKRKLKLYKASKKRQHHYKNLFPPDLLKQKNII